MKKSVYQRNYINSSSHWWWQARIKIFDSLIDKLFENNKNLKILDFGAGVGTNIKLLCKYGEVHVYEPNKSALNFISNNFKNIFVLNDMSNNTNKYNLILISDVLEHISRPIDELKILKNHLTQNGKLLITVPAHQYLFSKKDYDLHHYRRYSKKLLFSQLYAAKLKVEYITYFNFFLSPIIILVTIFAKVFRLSHIDKVEKKPLSLLNNLLYKIFSFESKFIAKDKHFPYGISILSIASK